MAPKKSKIQVLDEEGNVIKSATLKSTAKTPEGIPVEPEFEKPILSVTISNPIKKILYWLDQIRKNQTTTFAFKLSIPLIALPVLILAAYKIGKGEGLSLINIKTSPAPSISTNPSPQPTVEISRAGILKVAKGTTTRYLLQLRNGEIVNLQIPPVIDLSKYANKQVLVTGFQNKSTGVIEVTDIAQIEVFNETTIQQQTPKPSQSPVYSPSPESTPSAN